ncbi:hypothetical protein [Skermanella pratensis]|uniref:hypothetical protein n=1 Tax=Skermanella pratensis TaxID=2233999 RepID=UPI0013014D64|nr:hypothetical protein [Skermanella pratensis]
MRQEKWWTLKRGRIVAIVAVTAIVPAGAGFLAGRSAPQPVEVAQIACGLPKQTVSFSLPAPLFDVTRASLESGTAHRVPVWLGPFRHQGTSDVVRLRFSADAQGDAATVSRVNDVLHLPVHAGDPEDPPRRILLHCRNDVVAHVQYVSRSGRTKDFPVVQTMVAEGADQDSYYAAK